MTADERFEKIGYEPMSEEELMNFAEKAKDPLLKFELEEHKPMRVYYMPTNNFVIIIHNNGNVVAYDPTGGVTCLEPKEVVAVYYLYLEMNLTNEVKNG